MELPGKPYLIAGACKPFLIAGAVAWAALIAAILTLPREATVATPTPVVFDEPTPFKKADRLRIVAAEPVAVVAAPVQVAAARIDEPQTVGTTVSVRRHEAHNVCTRHGMHKVVTRGGRSWRCRK